MGYYINEGLGGSALSKVEGLKHLHKAEVIEKPQQFQENLVVVIDNGMFGAALYCYDEAEFEYAKSLNDGRPQTWLIVPNAKELAK